MERTDQPDDGGAWQDRKPHPPPPEPPSPFIPALFMTLQNLSSAVHVLHDETGRRFDVLDQHLVQMSARIEQLVKQGEQHMATLDDILAEVQAEAGAQNSAIVLLTSLHDELVAALASNDPAKLQAVVDGLKANADALAAAVAANPDPGVVAPPPPPPAP